MEQYTRNFCKALCFAPALHVQLRNMTHQACLSSTANGNGQELAFRMPRAVHPLPEIKAHFLSSPWCAKLFSDPSLIPLRNVSREPKSGTTGNTFVAKTLATDDGIIAWQFFYSPPGPGLKFGQIISVASLGSGLNGHVDTSHGGLLSVIFDEVIGTAAENYRPSDKTTMTAYLRVDYKKPVRTPAMVLCRAWVEERSQGRKIFGKASLEDGEGTMLATAEGLFLVVERMQPQAKL